MPGDRYDVLGIFVWSLIGVVGQNGTTKNHPELT
jgi:hypothetical protein